jgi:hypothetical protein
MSQSSSDDTATDRWAALALCSLCRLPRSDERKRRSDGARAGRSATASAFTRQRGRPVLSQSSSEPSSAGDCIVCGHWADKRYGGMGRYLAMCIDCWEASESEPLPLSPDSEDGPS